jgi:hypothetical protein
MKKSSLRRLAERVLIAITVLVMLVGSTILRASPTPVLSATVSSNVTNNFTANLTLTNLPSKGNPKLDSTLSVLASQNATAPIGPLMAGISPQTAEGTVRVIVEASKGQTNNVSTSARALGTIEGSYGNLIQMVVPASKLTTLSGLPNTKFVRLPEKPLPSVISEGVPLINANDWQTASYNGSGVKIGILDTGFSGYTTRQTEGELPAGANITTWWAPSIGNAGTGIHGTACAEIVYDIAPCATYYLANFATDVEYGQAVNWLISQNVTIISCSVGWPTGGPGDGTGFFCQVIDSAKAAGILWAQSIGNQAQRHWEGTWSNPGTDPRDIWHHFSGDDEGNTISVTNGDLIVVALKWNDPWYSSGNDYDLFLYDNSSPYLQLVAYSAAVQNGDDEPWEILGYYATYTGTYHIAIGKRGSAAPVNFHLYSYYQDLQYQTAANSLTVPADSFSAVAVGAVNYSTPTALESFSSHGPTDDGRIKPDLVAPDGVSTVTWAPYGPFTGTSASAPCTAGAAALVKQHFPSYTPAQIQAFLEGRAVDLGTAGKDNLYGAGRLDLGSASNNFTLTMATSGSGIIDSVTVYFRFKSTEVSNYMHGYCRPILRLGSSETLGTIIHAAAWDTYQTNSEVLSRPGGGSWSKSDLNSLQVGIGMQGPVTGEWTACDQVYVVVNYAQSSETLRPNAAGDYTNLTYQDPDTGYHWDKVDEEAADGYRIRTDFGTSDLTPILVPSVS